MNKSQIVNMREYTKKLSQMLFDKLEINLDKTPVEHLSYYTAIEYFLTIEDVPPSDATNLEKVNRYLESFYHLCQVEDWGRANIILCIYRNNFNSETLGTQLGKWGYYQKQIELFSKLYGKISKREDGNSLKILGSAYRYLSNYKEAEKSFREAENIFQKLGDKEQQADVLYKLGLMQLDRGQNEEADFHFKKSLSLFNELLHYPGIALVQNGRARIKTSQNKYLDTKKTYKIIRQIYDSHLSQKINGADYAWFLYDLGRDLADQGKKELNIEARKYSIMALKIFRKLDIKVGVAWSFYSLSILMLNLNKNKSAYICSKRGLIIFRELKNKNGIALSLHILGRISFRQKEYKPVKKYYQEKIKIWWESDNLIGIAFALEGFARLATLENQFEKAARLFGVVSQKV